MQALASLSSDALEVLSSQAIAILIELCYNRCLMDKRTSLRPEDRAAARARLPALAALGLASVLGVAAAVSVPRMVMQEDMTPPPQPNPDAPLEVIDVAPRVDTDMSDVLLRQCVAVEPGDDTAECTEYLLVIEQPTVQPGDTVIVR